MDNPYELTYKIPQDIFAKIPDYFWAGFAGELVSVFGTHILEKGEDDCYEFDYSTGTGGWNEALKMACHKLDMEWLYEYYDNLSWEESDLFDDELGDLVVTRFLDFDDASEKELRNAYYRWLIKRH